LIKATAQMSNFPPFSNHLPAGTFDVKESVPISPHPSTTTTTIVHPAHAVKDEALSAPRVLWINLREEPIVYVNNRPFVLREAGSFGPVLDCYFVSFNMTY